MRALTQNMGLNPSEVRLRSKAGIEAVLRVRSALGQTAGPHNSFVTEVSFMFPLILYTME